MRYTDLTNEELDAFVEMVKELNTNRITLFTFKEFVFGLNQKVKNRKSITLFKSAELVGYSIGEVPLD